MTLNLPDKPYLALSGTIRNPVESVIRWNLISRCIIIIVVMWTVVCLELKRCYLIYNLFVETSGLLVLPTKVRFLAALYLGRPLVRPARSISRTLRSTRLALFFIRLLATRFGSGICECEFQKCLSCWFIVKQHYRAQSLSLAGHLFKSVLCALPCIFSYDRCRFDCFNQIRIPSLNGQFFVFRNLFRCWWGLGN